MGSGQVFKGALLATSLAAAAITAAPGALAATDAAAPAVVPLEELDEVRVEAKRRMRDITAAEDAFFRLYNELNLDDRYDVRCGYASLSPGSLAMERICMPGYLSRAYADGSRRQFTMALGCYLTGVPVTNSPDSACLHHTGTPTAAIRDQAHATYGEEYARNFLVVVNSDERLQRMMAELSELYAQMDSVQKRFIGQKAGKQGSRMGRSGPR